MKISDLILWFFLFMTLISQPLIGVALIILVIILYKEQAKQRKLTAENKKHNELINAIKYRKED